MRREKNFNGRARGRERESCLVECERTRARECERTTVDSESHLASRLLFIVPCYSGFPRQSGRDAVKNKFNDRKENGNMKMKGRGKKATRSSGRE